MAGISFKFQGNASQLLDEVKKLRASVGSEINKLAKDVSSAKIDLKPGDSLRGFTQQLRTVIQPLSDQIQGLGGRLSGVFSEVAGGAEAAGAAAGGLAGAIGLVTVAAVAAEAALISLAIQNAKLLSSLDQQAEKTGIAAASLFKLQEAGKVAGVNFETIVEQLDFFNNNLAKAAADPAGKLSASFKKLGVDAKTAINEPTAALDEVIKRLGSIQNPAERLASTTKLFGEEGRKLVSVFIELNRNGGQYDKLLQQLGGREGFNKIVSSSRELTRVLAQLGQQFEALKLVASKDLIPALVVGFRSLIPVLQQVAPLVQGISKVAAQTFLIALAFLKASAKGNPLNTGIELTKLQLQVEAVGRTADLTAGKFKGIADETGKASKAAQDRLRALEQQVRDAEQLYDRETTSLKRQFDLREIAENAYVEGLKDAAQRRLDAINSTLDQEAAAVRGKGFKADERKEELDRILRERNDAQLEFEKELETINFDSTQRRIKGAKDLSDAIAEAEIEGLKAQRAALQIAAEQNLISQENAQTRLTEILRRETEIRIGIAQGEVDLAGENQDQREAALVRLRALEAQLTEINRTGAAAREKARQADLRNEERYLDELRDINRQAEQIKTDTLSTFEGSDADVIARRAALDRQLAIDRFTAIRRELEEQENANRREVADDFETQQQKLINRQRINELILAEARRLGVELENITRQQQVATEEADPQSIRSQLGSDIADGIAGLEEALGRPLTTLERLRLVLNQTAETLRQQLPSGLKIARDALSGFATTASQAFAAYLTGAQTLRQAAGSILQALLQPYIQYAQNKATIAFLESFEHALRGDFAGAAKWALIGAGWTALAGGISAVGSAAAGGSGGGSGGGSVANVNGTRQSEQSRATEDRIRFIDNTTQRFVTTVVIETEPGMFAKKVETAVGDSFRTDGTVKKVIENVVTGRSVNN